MAVVIARQKMVIEHAEGKHTVFPSPHPQSLPDKFLNHKYVKDAIASKWITVQDVETGEHAEEVAAPKRRRNA